MASVVRIDRRHSHGAVLPVATLVASATPREVRASPHRFARRVAREVHRIFSRRRGLREGDSIAGMKSIQETYAPNNQCFGCGPANDKGLRIRSFENGEELVAEWTPQPYHQ